MDAVDFERIARNPSLDRTDLETLMANALAKGNREFAAIAAAVLSERFPGIAKKSGGATRTTAVCLGRTEHFASGKVAYIWLVQRLRDHHAGLLENQDRWHQRAFRGVTRKYFARSPTELFPPGSALSSQGGSYVQLPDGWYANVNLNHGQKFDILLRLAAVCQLQYVDHWDFQVTGATQDLASAQKQVLLGQQLLEELRNV